MSHVSSVPHSVAAEYPEPSARHICTEVPVAHDEEPGEQTMGVHAFVVGSQKFPVAQGKAPSTAVPSALQVPMSPSLQAKEPGVQI